MLICPKCKCEYQDGNTICNDCKCELIELAEATEKNMLIEKDLKKNLLIGKLLTFGIVFAIGIIILINSLNLGDNEMSNIMKAHGGSMDTNQYIIYLEQSIINYKIVGSILSLLGGLGVLLTINSKL
ncbi:hypothetical protein [Candidatus Clostridium radicumherbarum]|uniref:Zinc ribbon domain-containing protein n=1 Tax=Candidatus Clostridium radicumherbarum TaxID=3381662 RepID=A0ABW8TUI5_9CLOT